MRNSLLVFIFLTTQIMFGQVENVPITHPVNDYLIRLEARGLLPNFSTSELPLQRNEIVEALKVINEQKSLLTQTELNILEKFLLEFEVIPRENAVVFYSKLDTVQVLGSEFIGKREKFFYHYKDDEKTVNLQPLGSFESLFSKDEKVFLGNLGVRFFGSLGSHFGYYIQATNGKVISGSRELALTSLHKLKQNVKFADLNSDFDFSESHIIFNYNWFSAKLGRETRLIGSGLTQRMYISDNAPASDAFSMSAKFKKFTYSYSCSELLATDVAKNPVGFNSEFPSKYLVTHRFAVRPSWGEIAFWEGLIFSKRGLEIAYLNPLSFFKSLEHALHDRDNSMMGGDFTLRPIDKIQLKGSFILDDLKFGEIGKGYWSNKTAWNLGFLYTMPIDIDFGIEYSRVEPYTFTHFDSVNSYTNDEMLIGTNLLPNSDETSIFLRYWWANRYPITFIASYERHGSNIYDAQGNLFRNVGGDVFRTNVYPIDSDRVTFMDGNVDEGWNIGLTAGWEIVRGFNIKLKYFKQKRVMKENDYLFISLAFEDF